MKTQHKSCAVLAASTLGLAGIGFASGFGDEKYIYDASGNIVEKHIGDQVTRFDYTGNQINASDGCSGRLEYKYDASGRLIVMQGEVSSARRMHYQYLDVAHLFDTVRGCRIVTVSISSRLPRFHRLLLPLGSYC